MRLAEEEAIATLSAEATVLVIQDDKVYQAPNGLFGNRLKQVLDGFSGADLSGTATNGVISKTLYLAYVPAVDTVVEYASYKPHPDDAAKRMMIEAVELMATGVNDYPVSYPTEATYVRFKYWHGGMAGAQPAPVWLAGGYGTRKTTTVNAATANPDYVHTLKVHTTTGTDDAQNIYFGAVDIKQLRFTKSDKLTVLPYTLVRSEGTAHTVSLRLPLSVGDNAVYVYYNRAAVAGDTYKIGFVTDAHYETPASYKDRHRAVEFLGNFVTRMSTYLPSLAVHSGDKTGASSTVSATQASWYQATLDAFAPVSAHATTVRDGVAPGNHDFEYMSYATTKAKHPNETWMVSGQMYGYWESTDYRFIALDSNYSTGTDNHLSLQHVGYGYVNPAQLTWLTGTLAESTKPCVVFIHHPCGEHDTEQWTLTKETYHTQNRAAIRTIFENSGKVIACISGHTHFHRGDVINNIPYLICSNLTNETDGAGGGFGELPGGTLGNWTLLDIDKVTKTIRHRREALIGTEYKTVYDQTYGWGPTTLTADMGEQAEVTYTLDAATLNRAAILRDATQLVATNQLYLYKFPANIEQNEPRLSGRTIKLVGRDAANIGRCVWEYGQYAGKVTIRYAVRIGTGYIYAKFAGTDPVASPGIYLSYEPAAGNMYAFNGSTKTILQALAADTWYQVRIEVDFSVNKFSLYVDEVLRATNFAFFSAMTELRKVEFVKQQGTGYIDNVRVSPYSAPTLAAWGGQETLTAN